MSVNWTSNSEYLKQQAKIDEGWKSEADQRAEEIYNKALDFANEIEAVIQEYWHYLQDEDMIELSNLKDEIENAVSLETRQMIGRDK